MTILAIRHLPTLANTKNIFQGRIDNDILYDSGFNSAMKENSEVIFNFGANQIFCSPLKRAIQTAKIYGFQNFTICHSIIEYDFGYYENRSQGEMSESQKSLWINSFSETNFGEGYDKFKIRIEAFLNQFERNDKVLIISHGVVIRYLLAKYQYGDVNITNQILIRNNSLHLIRI